MQELTEIMQVLQRPNGLKQMMLRPAFKDEETGHEFSQAELIADVINILRMDTKRIAQAHDIDVEIEQMTPERAAELLQGVAKGEDLGIIEIFDEIEDKRMVVLEAVEDEDATQEYIDMKQSLLYTHPNEPEDENHED